MTVFATNSTLFSGSCLNVIVERIGWVLIHSVWQFTLLAVFLIVAERLLVRRSAATRYLSSAVVLGLMLVSVVATFLVSEPRSDHVASLSQLDDSSMRGHSGDSLAEAHVVLTTSLDNEPGRDIEIPESDSLIEGSALRATPADTAAADATVTEARSIADRVSLAERLVAARSSLATTLRPWLPECVMVWLLGMAVAALRLVAGGLNVRRLRRRGLAPVSEDVLRILKVTAERLGLRRSVEIAQSSLVVGPVVIGWLRPMILLPATSLTGLTTEQLEAVIAHELAHVRRFDYVANLVQTVIETVFFYHPAVWWVSRRMRIHREDCCDDRAISVVATPVTYASALLALYELQDARSVSTGAPIGAMSATGGSLKKRIHRVLGLDEPLQSAPGWWLPTSVVGVVVLLTGCGLLAEPPGAAGEDESATPAVEPAVGDLEPVPETVPLISDVAQGLLPSATTSEEREQVLQHLESLGLSRREVFDIDPQRKPLPHVYKAHLWDVPQAAWPLLGSLYMTRELDMTASRVSPEAFRHVAGMRALQELVVVNSSFEAEHLAALAPLNRLTKIDVMFSVFHRSSEERRKQLGELTAEEQVRFDEIAGPDQKHDHIAEAAILTDRAMLSLAGLKELQTLRLINTFVSNVGLQSLQEMQKLEDVEISCGGSITRESASVFGSLPKLEKLELLGTIDADAAEGLKPALALKELELRAIDDGVAAVVAELQELEWLRLWASSLSDAGLLKLAGLKHLKHLDIRNSHRGTLTLTGIEQFQAARPGCVVVHDLSVESLVERRIPLPADHFVVRVHWRKATSRQQLAEHMQTRFGKSEHWVEFRPLTRAGYVGGMALVRGGEAGRDWLLAQIGADGDYDVSYAEPLSYKRLKDEGVFFDTLLKSVGTSPATAETSATKPDHPSGSKASATDRSASRSVLLPGEALPPFQELLARLRDAGQGATADGLQAKFDLQVRWNSPSGHLARRTNSVIAYGQVVATTGEPPQLCNAPMEIFEGGWFVAGIGDLDWPVGFRMFGCRPVDVVASKIVPAVEPDSVISLGQIVMEPYAESELATLRGRLKFATDNMPTGIRARVIISAGPTNSITGGTDGSLEWPEKENVTLASDLQFEHRRLSPLPHWLHIEVPGYRSVSRNLDLTPGATLDLGTIEIEVAPTFSVELLTSETSDFTESKRRSLTVPLGEFWKSNPDNEALRKYFGGDMRFTMYPVDRKQPDGEQKLIIDSGVASLKLADLGTGDLEDFRETAADPPKLRYTRDITIQSGHVYLGYHTYWKHWTLLRVTIE